MGVLLWWSWAPKGARLVTYRIFYGNIVKKMRRVVESDGVDQICCYDQKLLNLVRIRRRM